MWGAQRFLGFRQAAFCVAAVALTPPGVSVAQVSQGTNSANSPISNKPSQSSASQVEVVVVTAQKRAERLQDVPMSITALSGEQLSQIQAYRFEDYLGNIPGVEFEKGTVGGAGSKLTVRGITAGSQDQHDSVATYIDETPYVSRGDVVAGSDAPDVDPFDMQRIEVLKGPQGTLYGANALGGLLKFVTNAPDPSGYSTKIEAGLNSVTDGGNGFDFHGMVNVPIADDAAIRLVAYENYVPGFIDDPSRGIKNINGSHYIGARGSVLYEPTARLSIRFNGLYNKLSESDASNEDVNPFTLTPIFGPLTQERLISQPSFSAATLLNLTVNWDVGFAKIVSATSYTRFDADTQVDATLGLDPPVAALLQSVGDTSVATGPTGMIISPTQMGVGFIVPTSTRDWTQEVRMSADYTTWHWQIGGYYTFEHSTQGTSFLPIVGGTLLRNYSPLQLYGDPTPLGVSLNNETHRELAAFASLDYYLTSAVDAEVGGRWSTHDQAAQIPSFGILGPGPDAPPVVQVARYSGQSVLTYSGDLRWHLDTDNMLYARVASGFVPGGTNASISLSVPPSYAPSKTVNYEIGAKDTWLDNRLAMDTSLFDVEWDRIQLLNSATVIPYIVTASGARSAGLEWDLTYIPVDGLTLGAGAAYTNASLTKATPLFVGGAPGGRLPGVPLWATNVSGRYEHPIGGNYSAFVDMDWRFQDSRFADFVADPVTGLPAQRQQMPSYNAVDLRLGVETDRWSFTLYVKNVGNATIFNYVHPIIPGLVAGPQSASLSSPRTIGAEVTAAF